MVNKIIKIIGFIILIIVLTVFTQVGGLVLLATIPTFHLVNKKLEKGVKRKIVKPLIFIAFYLFVTFLIVPLLAKPFGRVPMPVYGNANLKPLNIFTCILNRHYVRPKLRQSLEDVAEKMERNYPGTVIAYLDANFPFIYKFPLYPHLSHSDGKKIDLAFFYIDSSTKVQLNKSAPSFIGYGVYEDPQKGETNMPKQCAKLGYWQYSYLHYFVPQWKKDDMIFDQKRTKQLILLLVNDQRIGKMFIEPHLKERMKLSSKKIRFHGCNAVRHDDHIHVQIK
ncbi:MAG: hypothetical protein P1P88_04205 [Bacteroidales bacterium]|nr:hypothetical protein [Bacteroidales bacterium]